MNNASLSTQKNTIDAFFMQYERSAFASRDEKERYRLLIQPSLRTMSTLKIYARHYDNPKTEEEKSNETGI